MGPPSPSAAAALGPLLLLPSPDPTPEEACARPHASTPPESAAAAIGALLPSQICRRSPGSSSIRRHHPGSGPIHRCGPGSGPIHCPAPDLTRSAGALAVGSRASWSGLLFSVSAVGGVLHAGLSPPHPCIHAEGISTAAASPPAARSAADHRAPRERERAHHWQSSSTREGAQPAPATELHARGRGRGAGARQVGRDMGEGEAPAVG